MLTCFTTHSMVSDTTQLRVTSAAWVYVARVETTKESEDGGLPIPGTVGYVILHEKVVALILKKMKYFIPRLTLKYFKNRNNYNHTILCSKYFYSKQNLC